MTSNSNKRASIISRTALAVLIASLVSCGGGGGSDSAGSATKSACDGACAHEALTETEVRTIILQAIAASSALQTNSTISVVDRVGTVLAVYQMPGAIPSTVITGQIGSVGGLEGVTVPASLAAISKAGTGAYLSSQGNAFSTRTAGHIIQENFAPGQNNQPGGPLFGVQFSQLPCSDIKDPTLGPRPLPLGLSADPGGIPLYKGGDLIGGVGIESDGVYSFDRNIYDYDTAAEEVIALSAAQGFDVPQEIRAERITVGGLSLRFADASPEPVDTAATEFNESNLIAVAPFFDGIIRAGIPFGSPASGIVESARAGVPAAYVASGDGSARFPTRSGASIGGAELSAFEVEALLDAAIVTAFRSRAAIRQPLSTSARVSIFIVDTEGNPLGFTRSQDAPIFGIDVALQKARTAAFFSSADANQLLQSAGFGGYVAKAQSVFVSGFDGSHAFSARALGNLSRPFFPDGINGSAPGPLSLPFPGAWSPFNTGLQLDLSIGGIAAPLSGSIPSSCTNGVFGKRLANGMQIFSGAVPLYRAGILIGAIGISGDGIFQDDMVAFYSASRLGLDAVGHTSVGDPELGFNAPAAIRSDTISVSNTQLRYVNCPESPFLDTSDQNVCEGQ